MSVVTIGERFQVVIPMRERKKMGIKPHTKVNVVVENDSLVIRPLTTKHWRGIGKELRNREDAADYVRKLRGEWERGF